MARSRRVPDLSRTIHAIGDLHYSGLTTQRRALYEVGLAKAETRRDSVAAHLLLGDLTVTGVTSEDNLFLTHKANYGSVAPVLGVLGNHDIQADVRTPEAAATALQLPGRNWTYSPMPGLTIVGWFPGDNYAASNSGSQASVSSLAWLDNTLTSISGDVWIACHFPLYDTVAGAALDTNTYYRSVDSAFYAATLTSNTDSSAILTLLNSHSNVKAWISGHTHSDLAVPGLLGLINVGSRSIAGINTSSVVPVNKAASSLSPINTMMLTHLDTGAIEVRVRRHDGGGGFGAVNGSRVTTLTAG